MAHGTFEFQMPAPSAVVFDAFHYHAWRLRWDSLVKNTRVEGGAPCPSVGAVTVSGGKGWMQSLSMHTRFVSYSPPLLAAATMVGTAFPFSRWAASMRHRDSGEGRSILLYTYTLEAGPGFLMRCIEPLIDAVFRYQTRKRFARLQSFLAQHAADVEQWQAGGRRNVSC